MLAFLTVLALGVVAVFAAQVADIEGTAPRKAPRAPRVAVARKQAGAMLDGAALNGLY